ncbi:hypothetical protein [Paracoccus aminovorans]|uniref:hypothetical protein n=1 Tax=Paracoccus aminovorans TaxID=34004 RepID=UPI002B262E46|nr:hypothetical protein [Paracoccus aminovorans]
MADPQLLEATATMDLIQQADAPAALRSAADEMRNLTGQFERGDINGEEFAAKLAEIQNEAEAAFASLSDRDSTASDR